MRTAVALALALIACGPSDRDEHTGGDGGNGSGSGNQDGCSDAAKLVYTVDTAATLSKFDPATRTFMDLGTLDCPRSTAFSQPFSMAVDRNAVAWILYNDPLGQAELMRVDTATLACTRTTWTATPSMRIFGMGYSTDTQGGSTDTLYIGGGTDPGNGTSTLGTLNTTSLQISTVGTVTGWPELSGTGNAELWGWFPSASGTPRVEKINKTSGAPLQTFPLAGLAGNPLAWAFAAWGGDFWVFLEREGEVGSTVYQVDGTTGSIESTLPTNTREIVGAGVSTCAPVIIL